jgi:UTP--glucose-1-phosphate uridylyltransferase
VWCARGLVGDEPFAVLLADDLMVCDTPCLAQMVAAYATTGGNLAAVIEVPRAHTSRYGVLDIVSDDGRLMRARGVVEKPDPGKAPSTSTIIGRYIIQPEVFGHLANAQPGIGGEIQLTDALGKLIDEGQPFHGLRFEGRRFDCGDKLGFLEATIALGLQHPELGPGLRKILSSYHTSDRNHRCSMISNSAR